MSPGNFCTACGARLARGARFCTACGEGAGARAKRPEATGPVDRRSASRTVLAIALTFGGVLMVVGAGARMYALDLPLFARAVLVNLALVAVGALGVLPLGAVARRKSFGGPTDRQGVWLGLAGGIAGLVVAFAYMSVLQLAASGEPVPDEARPAPERIPLGILLIVIALLPAAVEEWLCRGVLWEACRSALPSLATIGLTAGLFAFLHMMNGSGWFEVPHRFAFGLILGWLRLRTGSLVPCFLAHLVNNSIAVALAPEAYYDLFAD